MHCSLQGESFYLMASPWLQLGSVMKWFPCHNQCSVDNPSSVLCDCIAFRCFATLPMQTDSFTSQVMTLYLKHCFVAATPTLPPLKLPMFIGTLRRQSQCVWLGSACLYHYPAVCSCSANAASEKAIGHNVRVLGQNTTYCTDKQSPIVNGRYSGWGVGDEHLALLAEKPNRLGPPRRACCQSFFLTDLM